MMRASGPLAAHSFFVHKYYILYVVDDLRRYGADSLIWNRVDARNPRQLLASGAVLEVRVRQYAHNNDPWSDTVSGVLASFLFSFFFPQPVV